MAAIELRGRGARGEGFFAAVRREGKVGDIIIAATDTDEEILDKIADAAAVKVVVSNPAIKGNKGDPGSGGNVVQTKAALKALVSITEFDQYSVTDGGDAGVYTAYLPASFTAREAAARTEDNLGSMFPASTGSAGIVFYTKRDIIRPEMFPEYGNVDDPATAHLALTKAIRMSAALGLELVYRDAPYYTRYPTYLFSHAKLRGEGRDSAVIQQLTLAEIGGGDNTRLVAMMLGGFHPAYMSHVNGGGTGFSGGNGKKYYDWRYGDPIVSGQDFFQCTTFADAANFTTGDVVITRSLAYSSQSDNGPPGSVHLPNSAKLNLVAGPGDPATGRVPLFYEEEVAITGASLMAKANSATNPTTGLQQMELLGNYPLDAIHKAVVHGIAFICEDAVNGSPLMRCALLDCDFDLYETRGLTAAGGELICHSNMRYPKVRSSKRAIELAMGCRKSNFYVSGEHVHDGVKAPSGRPVKLGEGVWHNTIELDRVSFTGSSVSRPTAVVSIQMGGSNYVNVKGVRVIGQFQDIVRMDAYDTNNDPLSPHDPDQTQGLTADNHIHFEGLLGQADFFNYFTLGYNIVGADGLPGLRGSRLTGHFSGKAPTVRAGTLAGHGTRIEGSMEAGGVRWAADAYLVDINIRGGAFFESYMRDRTVRAELNNIVQGSAPTLVTVDGAGGAIAYAPDFNVPNQRIKFINCTAFQLIAPINAAVGKVARIELENGAAGAITPTFQSVYLPNGQQMLSMAVGRFIVLEIESLPSTAGVRYGLRRPIPGPS